MLALIGCGDDGYKCETIAPNVYECRNGDKVACYDETGHALEYEACEVGEAADEEEPAETTPTPYGAS